MVYTKARLAHALKVFRKAKLHRSAEKGIVNVNRHLRNRDWPRNCQDWTFAEPQHSSDDAEYCPSKERKLNKKKTVSSKRKAAGAVDDTKAPKTSKGEDDSSNTDTAVQTSLTEEKSEEQFAELSRDHRISHEYFDLKQKEPTSGYRANDWEQSLHETGDSASILGWKGEMSDAHTNDNSRTSQNDDDVLIRSNPLYNHGERMSRLEAEMSTGLEHRLGSTLTINHNRAHQDSQDKQLIHQNQPGSSRSDAAKNRSELSDSSSDIEIVGVRTKTPNRHDTGDLRERHVSRPNSLTASQPLPQRPANVRTFKTSYSHPINFLLDPRTAHQCDFCTDWTMGILGLGSRQVLVGHDPNDHTQIQELGAGHREEGHPPTKMCLVCSLGRHMIMRCHSAQSSAQTYPGNDPKFVKVHQHALNQAEEYSYLTQLFDQAKDRDIHGLKGISKGPLPSCSLCPRPAVWRCNEWQRNDKLMRVCGLPPQPRITPENQKRGPPMVISLLSDDEDEAPDVSLSQKMPRPVLTSTPAPAPMKIGSALPTSEQPQQQLLSSPAISQSESISISRPSNTSSTPTTNKNLRPPLQGCGLHLCNDCHTFVSGECNGLLDPKRIKTYFKSGPNLQMRADVEWLFQGSMLDRAVSKVIERLRDAHR